MKIDTVLLLTPNFISYPKYDYLRLGAPIGCASISSVIKNEVNVEFVDPVAEAFDNRIHLSDELIKVGLSNSEIEDRIKNISPQIVGVSNIHTRDHSSALAICQIAKKVDPEIITVLGGDNPSGNFANILNNNFVDFIVIGEGEIGFLNLILYLKGKLPYDSLYAIAKKDGNDYSVSWPRKDSIIDIESLPDPDWEIFKKEFYSEKLFHTGMLRGNYAIDLFTSRGCPVNCDYCCSAIMWGHKFRCLSIERITRQLQRLKELGYDEIILHDDNILANPGRAKQIFKFRPPDFDVLI